MTCMHRISPQIVVFVLFFEQALTETLRPTKVEQALQIAEATVPLNRVHPVSPNNYPSSSLLETCEARIPHYHISRLRDTHHKHRQQKHLGDGSSVAETHESATLSVEAAIRMTNLKDSQYVGPLKVGSQGDILSVVYDTGSTNLWFASTLCAQGPCLHRRRYDPEHSETFSHGDYDLRVTFGTGELLGSQGTDDVELGGFKVKQQTFSLIQREEGTIFDKLNFEGILGLAFPAMSANNVKPLFDQVMHQKLLKENSFSFYFSKYPVDASAVFFGSVDKRLYKGDLVRLPVAEQYYWTVGLKHFKVGDQLIEGPNKVVFDTGTTYYSAPKHLFPKLLALMPQTHCQAIRDGSAKVPNMTFTFVNHKNHEVPFVITPSEYFVSSGVDHMCDPAWMDIDVPASHGPAYIFGEAFMRSYFTSFYRGNGEGQAEVKVAPMNPDAVDLVTHVKKITGMSLNQQKETSFLQQQQRSRGYTIGYGRSFRKQNLETVVTDSAGDHWK